MQTEWEALELTDHQWALEDVEEELMAKDLHFEGMFKEELQTSIFWIWEYIVVSSCKRIWKESYVKLSDVFSRAKNKRNIPRLVLQLLNSVIWRPSSVSSGTPDLSKSIPRWQWPHSWAPSGTARMFPS